MLEIIYKQAQGNFLASVEVYFKEKPSKEVTTFLKQNNFRFTYKGGKHWWAYTNQFTNQILSELEELVKACETEVIAESSEVTPIPELEKEVEEVNFIEPIKVEVKEEPKAKTTPKKESYPALASCMEFELKGHNPINKGFEYKPIVDLNKGHNQAKIIYCHQPNYTVSLISDIIKLSWEYIKEKVRLWYKWRRTKTNFKKVKDLKKIEWKGFTEIAVIDPFGLVSVTKSNLKDFIKLYPNFRIMKLEKAGSLMLMQLDKKVNPSFDLLC